MASLRHHYRSSRRISTNVNSVRVNDLDNDFEVFHPEVYTSNHGVKSVSVSRIDPICGLNYNVVLSNVSDILYSEPMSYILLSNLNQKNKEISKKIQNFFDKMESKINMEKILCKLNDEYSYNKKKYKIIKKKCVIKNNLKIKLKFKSEDFLQVELKYLKRTSPTNKTHSLQILYTENNIAKDDLNYYIRRDENIKYNLYLSLRLVITYDSRNGNSRFNIHHIIQLNKFDIIDYSESSKRITDVITYDSNGNLRFNIYQSDSESENDEKELKKPFNCAICMEDKNESVKCQECQKIICKECAAKWPKLKGCPFCRSICKKT
jgi:hypothetical protein